MNPVTDSLKSRSKIYQLARTESETRVNDYNPLLLLLWKANIDIQFVAESSLALAHYVSGYVTKAEKSSKQEIWQEVSDNKSIYSRLWSFGVQSVCSRECGLYEASDLLLGDHLTEKSATIKWIDVSMPQKRSCRLKDHRQLEQLAQHDPNNKDIYEESLLDTHYPKRPESLEDVCLYDLVANYSWQSTDDNGKRQYTKLNKPCLPNHKLFDPQKENQREDYFYSLILLFVPFRDESSLLLENETAEEAFHRLMNEDSSAYHDKLQKILDAQSKMTEINEARKADGEEKRVNKEDDEDPQLMGEAKTAMHDMADMLVNHSTSDQLSFEDRIAMLNADQKRIFDTVDSHLSFNELQQSGQAPVCLFPTREMCKQFNSEMLHHLSSEVHEIVCTDEVDQTVNEKKAIEQLEKLNNDCSRTAGLEAKLLLAVGARVMLPRNIDTKTGLVNGALGTVLSISSKCITVQFDHVSKPYDVDKVQTKFMVMKNLCLYREQFPLILAYAVTIHKCQGLSLDCAIVYLSDKVFSAGMAYVALSRVRSLAGLHLSAFDPKSIIVSTSCLQEANRLREAYRKDLPLYQMPSKVQPLPPGG